MSSSARWAVFLTVFLGDALAAQEKDKLLGADDLVYLGAFRLPDTDAKLRSRFPYGGHALAFRAAPAGGQDSLFVAGHEHHQLVAEVTAPEPVKDRDLAKLPTAKLLQPFGDVTGGLIGSLGRDMHLGGLLVVDDKILWSIFKWYNVDGENLPSHGVSELDLTKSKSRGLWRIGAFHCQKTAGFLCAVPEPWQKRFGFQLFTGQCRMQGRATSSNGPAAFGFRTPMAGKTPEKNASLPAKHFLSYDNKARAEYTVDGKTHEWKGSNSVAGFAFPTSGGKSAVIFFVRVGLHPIDWYGEPGEFPGPGKVCAGGRGYHAPPYKAMAWFYDPSQLAAGKGAAKPYLTVDLSGDCFTSCVSISAVSYDAAKKRIYVIEQDADPKNKFESWPVVHTYGVK